MSHFVRSARFEEVLDHWVHMNESLAQAWEWKDCPWWCGEQAAVGLFASAVWLSGGAALSEYSGTKVRRASEGTRMRRVRPYEGRNDLCFVLDKKYYLAEGNYSDHEIGDVNGWLARMDRLLKRACRDVLTCPPDQELRLGIVFAAPSVYEANESRIDSIVASLQDGVTRLPCEDLACVFPERSRVLKWRRYVHPGAVVAIRDAGT
jgi:hypothetical protein